MPQVVSYFQKQGNTRDCVLCAFNNAMGYESLKKRDVVKFITATTKKLEHAYKKNNGRKAVLPASMKRKAKSMLSDDKNSYFSPDSVWGAAIDKSLIRGVSLIPKVGSSFFRNRYQRLMIMGIDSEGNSHAIASRNGYLYDSQHLTTPIPMSATNIHRLLPKRVDFAYKLVFPTTLK